MNVILKRMAKIESSSKIESKSKYILYLASFSLVLFSIFYLINKRPSYENEILSKCSDCGFFEEVSDTDWVLTKNRNNLSNIYDKSSKSFLLDNWYVAKYNEGILYDDITFQVMGHSIGCGETQYVKLSDKYLSERVDKIEKEESRKSNYKITCVCSSINRKCSYCVEKDFIKELKKPGGFRDRVLRP